MLISPRWWAALTALCIAACGTAGAAEVQRLKDAYREKSAEVLAPLKDSLIGAMERLEKSLGEQKKYDAALRVRELRVGFALQNPLELPDPLPEEPAELARLLNIYQRNAETRLAPWKTKYLAALGGLEERMAGAGNLAEAAAAKAELDAIAAAERMAEAQGEGAKRPAGDVALATAGAEASAPFEAAAMIDGETATGANGGFAYGLWPCDFEVELAEVFALRQIRVHLWSADGRQYKLAVETSRDGRRWEEVSDRSEEPVTGVHEIEFDDPKPVKAIRVRGLHNSANERFYVVEIEAR